jgi:hypothetical protein
MTTRPRIAPSLPPPLTWNAASVVRVCCQPRSSISHVQSMLTVVKLVTSLRTALRAAVVKKVAVAAATVGECKALE